MTTEPSLLGLFSPHTVSAQTSTTRYYYDALGRAIASFQAGNPANYSSQYYYDQAGNRTTLNVASLTPACCNGVMTAGQMLTRGQTIVSNNGQYTFAYQTDDNLVVYRGATPLWTPWTNSMYGAYLVMQGDGNLVLYDPHNSPLWWSGTQGNPGAWLTMQNDGNLVIYSASGQALWDYSSGIL